MALKKKGTEKRTMKVQLPMHLKFLRALFSEEQMENQVRNSLALETAEEQEAIPAFKTHYKRKMRQRKLT